MSHRRAGYRCVTHQPPLYSEDVISVALGSAYGPALERLRDLPSDRQDLLLSVHESTDANLGTVATALYWLRTHRGCTVEIWSDFN